MKKHKRQPLPLHPKAGETFAHCGHAGNRPLNWYYAADPLQLGRPDGSVLITHWMGVCDSCIFVARQPERAIRADGIVDKDVKVYESPDPLGEGEGGGTEGKNPCLPCAIAAFNPSDDDEYENPSDELEVPSDSPGDFRRAMSKLEEFHQRAPKKHWKNTHTSIPRTVVVVGEMLVIRYSSDKWGEDRAQKYFHEHDGGVKCGLVEDTRRNPPDGEVVEVPQRIRGVQTLTFLGRFLDGEYVTPEGKHGRIAGSKASWWCSPDGHALFVVDNDTDEVLAVVWGGDLGVEARGIVH